ncbi:MAG: putative lipid II flippase FtsW [Solirubrobacterales bacterium]
MISWLSARREGRRRRRAALSTEYNMLLTATLCLLAFGAVMVFSASSTTRILSDGSLSSSVYFLKRTVIVGALGLLGMHLLARHGLTAVRRLTPGLLIVSFFLLCAVLVAGTTVNGASRWIGPGALQIQPSELAKLTLVLYAAHMLAEKPKMTRTIGGMMPVLLVSGLGSFLVFAEPDLGTAMVITFATAATLVAAGARIRDLLLIAGAIALLVFVMILIEPYRRERLIGFLHPGADAAGSGFQALQAKIALGSGGLFGTGIGNGVQKAYYLPEAHTDMIAAVIGEEIGFIGIAGIAGLFCVFGYAGFRIAQTARDRYAKLLAAGLTALVLSQAVINLFAVLGLAPLTGVPLPFVSYGNSSLLVSLLAVGLILNIARGGTARAAAGRPAGKLRVVEGGRATSRGRSRSSGAKSRDSRGRDRRPRRAGDGRRRRASR